MTDTQIYDKYISTHFGKTFPNIQCSYKKRYYLWKSYLAQFLPISKDSIILEVGSAMGHNLYSLKRLGYNNVVGIDISKECADFCMSAGFNSTLIKNEEEFYNINQNQFDVVILYDVLEHYFPIDGISLLVNIKKVLKYNGVLIISLPNANHPFSMNLLYADITHKFIYNESSLLQLLKNSGFEDNKFIQICSYTTYDDNLFKRFFKNSILKVFSFMGELFWKVIGLTQGIILKECKPSLICISQKK